MIPYLQLLALTSISTFFSASVLYTILVRVSGKTCLFSTFQGSSSYHCLFPYQYIGILSLAIGLLLPLWLLYFLKTSPWKRYTYLLITAVGIFFLSCVLGGVLWATHEVFLVGDHRGMGWPLFYWFEIKNTLYYGGIVLVRSFPLNIVFLCFATLCVHLLSNFFTTKTHEK